MYSVFLVCKGQKEFYCCIDAAMPERLMYTTVKNIMAKKKCDAFIREVTASGEIIEQRVAYLHPDPDIEP